MEITAAIATAAGTDFALRQIELDDPRDDEVLVAIRAVGLCHTDLVFRDLPEGAGIPLPAVFGHEGVGIVERVGQAVTKVAPGDPVLLTFRSCGQCGRCHEGVPSYCDHLIAMNYAGCRLDGSATLHDHGEAVRGNFFGQSSFATHALTYERNVVKLDSADNIERYAPLGCGVQTGAGAVLKAMDCAPGTMLVVIGTGTVGLSAIMAARYRGCSEIIGIDLLAERRALALELGATHVLDPSDGNVVAAIRAIRPQGAHYVLDCSGAVPALETALGYMAPAATLGLVGVPGNPAATLSVPLSLAITFGFRIQGIIEGDADPDKFIPELIELQRSGVLPFDRLISYYPFDKINEAIAAQHSGKAVKVVLKVA